MKYYNYNGTTYENDIPDPLDGVTPMHKPDGSVNETRFVSMGGTINSDEETLTIEQREFRDSQCCVYFRSLVVSVRNETGDTAFTGGYEEWPELKQNYPEVFEKYISLFNALDNWCKKDAGKYGWGSPEWFYICWNRQPPQRIE